MATTLSPLITEFVFINIVGYTLIFRRYDLAPREPVLWVLGFSIGAELQSRACRISVVLT